MQLDGGIRIQILGFETATAGAKYARTLIITKSKRRPPIGRGGGRGKGGVEPFLNPALPIGRARPLPPLRLRRQRLAVLMKSR